MEIIENKLKNKSVYFLIKMFKDMQNESYNSGNDGSIHVFSILCDVLEEKQIDIYEL